MLELEVLRRVPTGSDLSGSTFRYLSESSGALRLGQLIGLGLLLLHLRDAFDELLLVARVVRDEHAERRCRSLRVGLRQLQHLHEVLLTLLLLGHLAALAELLLLLASRLQVEIEPE